MKESPPYWLAILRPERCRAKGVSLFPFMAHVSASIIQIVPGAVCTHLIVRASERASERKSHTWCFECESVAEPATIMSWRMQAPRSILYQFRTRRNVSLVMKQIGPLRFVLHQKASIAGVTVNLFARRPCKFLACVCMLTKC
jgi:hypothetical protein